MKSMLALCLLVTLSGCMAFEVEGDGELTQNSCHGSETVHGSFWGFSWHDRDIEKCFDGSGLYRVEFSTNAFFALASVASIGFYVPQTVEWWCQALVDEDEEDGELLLLPSEG